MASTVTAAFAPSVPISSGQRVYLSPRASPRQSSRPVNSRVCRCSAASAKAPLPPKSSSQEPSLPCLEPASGTPGVRALRDALALVFQGANSADAALEDVLAPSCGWESPVLGADNREGIAKCLEEFAAFVLDPVIMFTGENEESGGPVRLEWLLSFTQPLPWRPRITVSGRSFVSLDEARTIVTQIVDEWDVSPWSVVRQALPRVADMVWLYAAPHAELDFGTRKLLKNHSGYSVVRVAARPEILVESELGEKEFAIVTAVPAVPPYAFVGGLRRLEEYSTVSPISVRITGELRCEFSIPVPGTIFGSSNRAPLPAHPSEDVRVVLSPARKCAVLRYRGFASEELFESKLAMLVEKLKSDGYLEAGQAVDRSRVWARSYDSKIGFNTASQVAIGTCGATGGFPPRWNELLVELPEISD